MTAAPRVWALVLTYGGQEEITAACIDSLLASDYPALTTLLIDNASFDGSGERLRDRYPGIAYLNTGGNLGYAGGNNRGMAYALERGADHVLVLNNDTIVEPDCISRLVATAGAEPKVGLVAPKILYFDLPDHVWFAGGDFSPAKAIGIHRREMERDDAGEPPRTDPITFATGCCFLMPAGVVRSAGMFEESFFMYCEDVELSLRVARAGYRLLYQPAARLYHRQPPGVPDSSPFQIRHRDRNRRRVARMHLTPAQRLRFYAFFYPSRAVRFTQYVMRRRWQHAAAIVEGAFR